MRLIDGDALIEAHYDYCNKHHDETAVFYGWSMRLMKEAPSAQPEIIRCKDCKHYTPIKRTDRWWCRCEEGLWSSNEDDFCSYAERREDE